MAIYFYILKMFLNFRALIIEDTFRKYEGFQVSYEDIKGHFKKIKEF